MRTSLIEFLIEKNLLSEDDKINLQLKKFIQRKDFAKKKFLLLNKGSGRLVFQIGDEYILKLAKNNKGIAQNKTEIKISNSGKYKNIIANIFEYDDNGFYLIQQKAKPINDTIFKELTGLQLEGFLYSIRFNREWDKKWNGYNFYNEVKELINEFGLDRFDIANETSWGVINGKVIIVDYGLDNITARELYGVTY